MTPKKCFHVIQVEYVCTNLNLWIVFCKDRMSGTLRFQRKETCPNMTLRCEIKDGESRPLVKASATRVIFCVQSGISLAILTLTNLRLKHRRISICRDNFRRTGFSLIVMHAKLSSKKSAAAVCMYPKSPSVSHKYTTSWEAWL